ncbi:acylneuraminate cytidylyltransferase family protein [Candidatus Woesearchaeota archaeon]|jgi:N-acylneuraminate cytidylyltransferase|nr:acylneuraminate cytidylyltransferase family protein [Candidatus Woesearchaeota archaeon]
MKYVVLICARGGSKGLPGKNIKPLNGIPLIGWSINIAKQIDRVSHIVVSTDSEDIAKVALEYGAEVPFMRPKELAQDNSPEWLVWRHAIKHLEDHGSEDIDAIIVLPVTAPLRSVEDVNSCIDLFEEGRVDSVITVSKAGRSPHFNMIVNDDNGYASIVISPESQITRRQDAPEVFDVTTVAYIVNTSFVKRFNEIFKGKVRSVIIPQERSIDIDTLLDFKIAECLVIDR